MWRYGQRHGTLPARAVEGEIKERRGGGPLDEAGVRAVVLTKEDKRKGKGGPVWGTTVRGREPIGRQEKEKRTVHKDGECGTMPWPRENGVLKDPTQTAFAGHVAK